MQLIPRYLVSNRTTIVANEAGFVTEFRPVYSRQIQVYKGIDNILEFRLLNADQKPIDVSGYIPRFVAFDEFNNLVIEHEGTPLDDSSNSTRGLFTVNISENDLLNVKQQYLKYNIYLVDSENQKILTYSHSNFDNDATIFVNARAFPGPRESLLVSRWTKIGNDTDVWYTDAVEMYPAINNNEALHTAAIYSNGFEGVVYIEATLEDQLDGTENWAEIAEVTLDGTETEPVPVNFTGVVSYVRFRTETDPSDVITKILVRT